MNESADQKAILKAVLSSDAQTSSEAGDPPSRKSGAKRRGFSLNLSSKLLLLTIGFVMLSEVFVFVPSVAKFRNDWLTDRLTRARTVLLMIREPEQEVLISEKEMANEGVRIQNAIKSFDVVTLASRTGGRRQLIANIHSDVGPPNATFDVIETGPLQSIRDAFRTLLTSKPTSIVITGSPPGTNQLIEVVALEAPLRQAMLTYTRNVLILSLIISVSTAAMVYFTLSMLFVRPIKRMAENMVEFSQNPERGTNIIEPSNRGDEIGVAEERLSEMQKDLQGTLSSQRHLANLGLAVSKVNHDLRNILASVQLFSDRLTMLQDPEVQRFAPKLISGIDRAISYCEATLVYGSATEKPPNIQVVKLHALVEEIGSLLDLEEHNAIEWNNKVEERLEIDVDPEQIFRVLMNLSRNSVKVMEAMEGEALVRRLTINAEKLQDYTKISVQDTGPGVPPMAKKHLFEAFQGSISKGGTGLGLAIAYEIVNAHGGAISLVDHEPPGATFEIHIPDRGKTLSKESVT